MHLQDLKEVTEKFVDGQDGQTELALDTQRVLRRTVRVVSASTTVELGNLGNEVTVKLTSRGNTQVFSEQDFQELLVWAVDTGFVLPGNARR